MIYNILIDVFILNLSDFKCVLGLLALLLTRVLYKAIKILILGALSIRICIYDVGIKAVRDHDLFLFLTVEVVSTPSRQGALWRRRVGCHFASRQSNEKKKVTFTGCFPRARKR